MLFRSTKRLCELGRGVDEESAFKVFSNFDELLTCAASDATDAEKVAMLTGGNGVGAGEDPFNSFFYSFSGSRNSIKKRPSFVSDRHKTPLACDPLDSESA